MSIVFSPQEFQYLQQYANEMYQSANLRTGPSGDMIVAIRGKFLTNGLVDLTDGERRFMIFALQDTFQSSHSPVVTSQMGNTMRVLGSSESHIISSINQNPSQMSGTYLTQWEVIKSCLTKLGLMAPPPYTPLVEGPDGDVGGISTPTGHDINDGTGYNHR